MTEHTTIADNLKNISTILGEDDDAKTLTQDQSTALINAFSGCERRQIAIVYLHFNRQVKGVPKYKTAKEYFNKYLGDKLGCKEEYMYRLKLAGEQQEELQLPIGSCREYCMRFLREWQKKYEKQNGNTVPTKKSRQVIDTALKDAQCELLDLQVPMLKEAIYKLGLSISQGPAESSAPSPEVDSLPTAETTVNNDSSHFSIDQDESDNGNSFSNKTRISEIKKEIEALVAEWAGLVDSSKKQRRKKRREAAISHLEEMIDKFD